MRFYWSITPDTPTDLAERYIRYDLAGVERGRQILRDVEHEVRGRERVLEIGCRTGGFLVAAGEQFRHVVAIDIAFRWLVVAKRRVADAGKTAQLVCCCAQHLPFRAEQFDLVVAGNVIEHTSDPQALVCEAHRVLVPGGCFYTNTCNRYSVGPEPHVRVWGVGFLPRRWMDRYVRLVRGIPYEHVRLVSFAELRRLLRRAGFARPKITPPQLSAGEQQGLSPPARRLIGVYNAIRTWPGIRQLLLVIGPWLGAVCVKRGNG